MRKPISPAAPNSAPKPTPSNAPAALRRRGIHSASEAIEEGQGVRCWRALWVFYGRELAEHFIRQPEG